jgi:membrane-associated phospholipid phosphatase
MPEMKVLRQPILWIFGSGAAYAGLFFARPLWYTAHCQTSPDSCSVTSLNPLDRMIPIPGSIQADSYSNWLQNGAGTLAWILPWIILRKARLAVALNLMLLAIAIANGALMEVIRALVQRPRPIVLASPAVEAANIHHYTSFYSGHTSFVALALFFTVLWARRLSPAQRLLHGVLYLMYGSLSLGTAILRVLGGRHYPTDTLAGWFFGTLLAFYLAGPWLSQLKEESSASI